MGKWWYVPSLGWRAEEVVDGVGSQRVEPSIKEEVGDVRDKHDDEKVGDLAKDELEEVVIVLVKSVDKGF